MADQVVEVEQDKHQTKDAAGNLIVGAMVTDETGTYLGISAGTDTSNLTEIGRFYEVAGYHYDDFLVESILASTDEKGISTFDIHVTLETLGWEQFNVIDHDDKEGTWTEVLPHLNEAGEPTPKAVLNLDGTQFVRKDEGWIRSAYQAVTPKFETKEAEELSPLANEISDTDIKSIPRRQRLSAPEGVARETDQPQEVVPMIGSSEPNTGSAEINTSEAGN